jgi:nucleotide sugar dehydrogenase
VPIGTCRLLAKNIEVISKLKCGEDFYLGFAPERTIEGNALKEIESLPQIVAGYSSACIASVRSIVEMWNSSILTASSLEMAEMVKLSNNAYRDHHFSFANELALIADTHNLDINEVVQLGNLGYSRSNIAIPSLGVGGPCLSKDSYILLSKLEEIENQTRGAIHEEMQIGSTILSARELNRRMPYFVAEKIIKELSNQPKPHIGLAIGMAFKGYPATNDLRNSPAVDAVKILIQNNVEMFCWDYVVASNQLQGYGLQSLPSASSKSRPLPLFCMIGNNHPENILKIRELTNQFETIKKVFDPWDLLRTSGNLEYYIQKGISVFNLSSRISP